MDALLYVYDSSTLKSLRKKLLDYQFFSIAYFLHRWNTLPELAETSEFEKSVVDITNLMKDGNYFRVFTEQYLWTLSENIADIHFCLHYSAFESFLKQFPYMFEEKKINFDFHSDISEENQGESVLALGTPLALYSYANSAVAKKLYEDGLLLSLSELIDECEGIVFQYNINNISKIIEEHNVEYIDLSSIIKTLKIRNDLIFQFEILIHHISAAKGIRFCSESSLVSEVSTLFPFFFSKELHMDGDKKDEVIDEKPKEIDISTVTSLVNSVCEKLRGHNAFKEDFKHNLLKFSFLNRMGERKILSIILCGDSGIGKTEFAKIMSDIIYPKEPLVKINFGNYSNEGVLNSLIGSPLGYVGCEEGGELINKISMSKSRIILIDEFERATPSVFNFFYELLEDGIFTDRHGIAHNLNGYIIVFTSNMTQIEYHKHIPNSLKSRFDMVFYFVDLPAGEKKTYIFDTANTLMEKLNAQFGTQIVIENIQRNLDELVRYNNLRDIKRKVEDIVFNEFFRCYKNN